MASIPGSQYVVTANGETVRIVETANRHNLPPPIAGQFNLEVWTGFGPAPHSPAPGYNGLAVLSPTGDITLVSGAFEVQDASTGGVTHTMTAAGSNETIAAGPGNNDRLILTGNNDEAIGGGRDTIDAFGNGETIRGVGDDLIQLWGDRESVQGGSGNDTILVHSGSEHDTVRAGSGNDVILVQGDHDLIRGGRGNDTIVVFGGAGHDTIDPGGGKDVVLVAASNITVNGGAGGDTIGLFGDHDAYVGGRGPDTVLAFGEHDAITLGRGGSVTVAGSHNTINAGANAFGDHDTVTLLAGSQEFVDNGQVFADTVIGFNAAGGDRIHLTHHDKVASTGLVNGGHDTLITLSDNSTILLKGITHIGKSFFS